MCPASSKWKRKYTGGKITVKICMSNKNVMGITSGLKETYNGESNLKFFMHNATEYTLFPL
jgi:hypothetical protein